MTLHSCFKPASLNSPTRSPKKTGAAIRIRSRRDTHRSGDGVEELSGGTGRQCRGAVRHWGSPRDLTTELHLHWWLICNYSNRIQSFALCSQPRQPSPPTQGTLHAGVGAAVPSTVPEEWDPPSWAGWTASRYPWTADFAQLTSAWCPKRGQAVHQQLREMHCGAIALGKRIGIWCLVWSFGNA